MKELNKKTTLYILGILIICIFTFISVSNILNFQKESNNYYIKLNDQIEEKVEIIEVNNNKLIIKTNDDRKVNTKTVTVYMIGFFINGIQTKMNEP